MSEHQVRRARQVVERVHGVSSPQMVGQRPEVVCRRMDLWRSWNDGFHLIFD